MASTCPYLNPPPTLLPSLQSLLHSSIPFPQSKLLSSDNEWEEIVKRVNPLVQSRLQSAKELSADIQCSFAHRDPFRSIILLGSLKLAIQGLVAAAKGLNVPAVSELIVAFHRLKLHFRFYFDGAVQYLEDKQSPIKKDQKGSRIEKKPSFPLNEPALRKASTSAPQQNNPHAHANTHHQGRAGRKQSHNKSFNLSSEENDTHTHPHALTHSIRSSHIHQPPIFGKRIISKTASVLNPSEDTGDRNYRSMVKDIPSPSTAPKRTNMKSSMRESQLFMADAKPIQSSYQFPIQNPDYLKSTPRNMKCPIKDPLEPAKDFKALALHNPIEAVEEFGYSYPGINICLILDTRPESNCCKLTKAVSSYALPSVVPPPRLSQLEISEENPLAQQIQLSFKQSSVVGHSNLYVRGKASSGLLGYFAEELAADRIGAIGRIESLMRVDIHHEMLTRIKVHTAHKIDARRIRPTFFDVHFAHLSENTYLAVQAPYRKMMMEYGEDLRDLVEGLSICLQ